jgi:hypothetical protein
MRERGGTQGYANDRAQGAVRLLRLDPKDRRIRGPDPKASAFRCREVTYAAPEHRARPDARRERATAALLTAAAIHPEKT